MSVLRPARSVLTAHQLGTASPPPSLPRMLHVDRRTLQNAVRNVLDGELLNRYLYLSTMERGELAKKIGTTPDIVSELLTSAPPAPLLLPSPTSLPTDPGRPVRDGPCHCSLLDPWTLLRPLCLARPPFCTTHPAFVQKHEEKALFDLRRACGHCPTSWPQLLRCPRSRGLSTPPALASSVDPRWGQHCQPWASSAVLPPGP